MVVLFSGLALVSCKKDEAKIQTPAPDELVSKQFLDDVHWFLNAAKVVKTNPNAKSASTEKITLDSALYYFDATLNYKYGFASARFNDQKIDTVLVKIRLVPGEKKVYVDDAALAYNQVVNKLRLKYSAIDETIKELQGCILENAGKTPGNDSAVVRVIGIFGTGAPIQPNIDEYGYRWHRNSGNCDFSVMGYGAPEYMESQLSTYFCPPPPSPFHRVVFTNLMYSCTDFYNPTDYRSPDDSLDNYCDYKIFYMINTVCEFTDELRCLGICEDKNGQNTMSYGCEMNYYIGSMTELLEQFLQDHGNKSLFTHHIESVTRCPVGYMELLHRITLWYGTKKLIDIRSEERMDYPLTILSTD